MLPIRWTSTKPMSMTPVIGHDPLLADGAAVEAQRRRAAATRLRRIGVVPTPRVLAVVSPARVVVVAIVSNSASFVPL